MLLCTIFCFVMRSKFIKTNYLRLLYFWILNNEFINCGYTNSKDPKRNIVFEQAKTTITTTTKTTTTTSKQTPYATEVIPKEQITDLPAKVDSNQTMGRNITNNSSTIESNIITTELPLQLNTTTTTNKYSKIPMQECKLIIQILGKYIVIFLYR